MFMTSPNIRSRFRLPAVAASVVLVAFFANSSPAQVSKSNSLPRVGTIRDYPATGLMTGCGNLYFYKASDTASGDANYVFLSRGDGTHAWMNLNGRDVLLRKIKSRGDRKFRRHSYSYRDVRITVELEDFAPDSANRRTRSHV